MTRTRIRRLLGLVSITALLTSALVVPAASLASTPGWSMQVDATPHTTPCATGIDFCATVNPAAYVKFKVTITNNGKSNIAQLYLTDTIKMIAYRAESALAGEGFVPITIFQ